MIAGIAAFFAALFVIVLLHELGHLVAAKWTGMPASVFSVGFGRRLFGFHWRGTDYRFSAIPLGGYVRIDPMEETVEGPHGPTTRFDTFPWVDRVAVVSAGVLMNMVLALGIYVALPVVWGVEETQPRVFGGLEAAAVPVGAAGWSAIPVDAEVVAVGDEPVATFESLVLAVAGAVPGSQEVRLADGREIPVTVPTGDEAKLALARAIRPARPPVVGEVVEGEPAAVAGLRDGDRIVAVDGVPVRSWGGFMARVEASPGRALPVRVERDGTARSVVLTPRPGRGPLAGRGVAGVGPGVHRVRVSPMEALPYAAASFDRTLDVVRRSWSIMVRGRLSARQVSGPITAAETSARLFRSGWEPFLSFVAFLSINIAIVNFLPIPALDGGYMALLGVELVRRRPVSQPVQAYLGRVGMIWLCLVMAGTVLNDLLRLAGL